MTQLWGPDGDGRSSWANAGSQQVQDPVSSVFAAITIQLSRRATHQALPSVQARLCDDCAAGRRPPWLLWQPPAAPDMDTLSSTDSSQLWTKAPSKTRSGSKRDTMGAERRDPHSPEGTWGHHRTGVLRHKMSLWMPVLVSAPLVTRSIWTGMSPISRETSPSGKTTGPWRQASDFTSQWCLAKRGGELRVESVSCPH